MSSSRQQKINSVSGQGFDKVATLGVSKSCARRDHSHGTPNDPGSEKGVPNGYASLDAAGTVPDAQIPAGVTRDTEAAAAYAPISNGVTNGDSHNHSGGDGGQIDHGGLAGLADDDHAQYHNDTRGDARYVAKDSVIRLKGYTVSTLPAGTQGDTCFVTDALAPTFLAIVVGGGAIVTPVFYNGTNWVGY